MPLKARRAFWIILAASAGFIPGCVGGWLSSIDVSATEFPFLAVRTPLPHHIPKYPGALTFRFAMVQDVLHERYPKHGPAHYDERNRLRRDALAKLPPDDPSVFPLADDLAVGLERVGHSDQAVVVMRRKLDGQKKLGLGGGELYTSYANLGTVLAHSAARQAIAGDADARKQFREGIDFVRESIKVNPQAHFGRERWQAAFYEFMLAAMEKPDCLMRFDFLGNRLDLSVDDIFKFKDSWEGGYGSATNAYYFGYELNREDRQAYRAYSASLDDPSHWQKLERLRRIITKIGAEEGWKDLPIPSHREPVPFDEPVLGIIGMWRQGGGPSPQFCLALGETMLRVGQRFLAWSAFERASRLADRFWPDPVYQQFLRNHCANRQRDIERYETITNVSLREAFDKELAYGEGFQKDYQQFEVAKISAGAALDDEHFFDEFYAGRDPIASPTGEEEWISWAPAWEMREYAIQRGYAVGVFLAGLAGMSVALLFRLKSIRARAKSAALNRPSQDFERAQGDA
jgi:hypothetical protein